MGSKNNESEEEIEEIVITEDVPESLNEPKKRIIFRKAERAMIRTITINGSLCAEEVESNCGLIVKGDYFVHGDDKVSGSQIVYGIQRVVGDQRVERKQEILCIDGPFCGGATQFVGGTQIVSGDQIVNGNQTIMNQQKIGVSQKIIGSQEVGGDQEIGDEIGGDQIVLRSKRIGGDSKVKRISVVGLDTRARDISAGKIYAGILMNDEAAKESIRARNVDGEIVVGNVVKRDIKILIQDAGKKEELFVTKEELERIKETIREAMMIL